MCTPDEKVVVAIACDQSGVRLKTLILNFLRGDQEMNDCIKEVIDFGTQDERTIVDFPKYAKAVCEAIKNGEADFGILISGMGVEMSMAANRFQGIRAVATNDFGIIQISRETMDMNVLCLASRIYPSKQQTMMMVKAFIGSPYQPQGRHARRVQMLDEIAVPPDPNVTDVDDMIPFGDDDDDTNKGGTILVTVRQ